MKNSKFILLAMFLTIASLLGGNALCASGVMHDANPKKHKTVSPKTDEVDAVNLVKTNIPLGSNTIYNLTNDSVLTIQYRDSRTEGTKFGLNFSSSEATDRWVTRPGEDIRSHVKKVVFKANAKGVKIDFDGCNLDYFFDGFTNLEEIDFSGVKANSRVGNISHMFQNCKKLKEVDLSWMTSNNVTWDMKRMFQDCKSLEKVVLNNPGFKTRKTTATNTGGVQTIGIFSGCSSLKYVDMSNITIYGRDYNNDWGLYVNTYSGFNRVELFPNSKSSLEEVYFNNTKFEHVSSMKQMFANCTNLKRFEMKSSDGTSLVPDVVMISEMFANCTSLEHLDISGFGKLDHIVNMSDVVLNCTSLKTLIIDNLDNSRIAPINTHPASENDAGAAALNLNWARVLGIATCTALDTLSAKNSKVWMCKDNRGVPGSPYFDVSTETNQYYFTKNITEFYPDDTAKNSVTIETLRDYLDLINDRDGINMPSLNGLTNFPDTATNINMKYGDLNTNGSGFLAPGVYVISKTPWVEKKVVLDSMTYYRIAYLEIRPYTITGKEYAMTKGLVFSEFNDNGMMDTHVNTENKTISDWGTSGNYVIDLTEQPLVFKYENAAIDVNGKLHDVKVYINKVTFKNLERIPTRPNPSRLHDANKYRDDSDGKYFRPVLRATQGEGIMFLNYARQGNPELGNLTNNATNYSILTGGSGTEIDFKVEIDSANDGTSFIFNCNDLDVPAAQNWLYPDNDACHDSLPINNVTYGLGSESFILGKGNDLSSVRFAEHTGLAIVNDSIVVPTGSDPSTSWSEFSVVSDAKGANYTWTSGISCTSYGLRDTDPLFINNVAVTPLLGKVFENGNLNSGDFTFELINDSIVPAGAPEPQGSLTANNTTDGSVSFNLTFEKTADNSLIYDPLNYNYYPGTNPTGNKHGAGTHNTFTYYYTVKEKIPNPKSDTIFYDTTAYNMKIVVRTPENDEELNKKGIIATIWLGNDSIGEICGKDTTSVINLKNKITFRNKTRRITLVNTWIDENNITGVRPTGIIGTITYTYEGQPYSKNVAASDWVKTGDVWTASLTIPYDAVVTNWGETTVPAGYDFEKDNLVVDNVYKFTNTLKYFDIVVSKTVDVDGTKADRHKNKDFNFTFKSIPNRAILAIKNKKDTISLTLNANGITTFNLKDTNSMKLTNIPYGASYSVVESNYGSYTVSTTLTGDVNTKDTTTTGTAIAQGNNIDTIADSFLKDNVDLVYKNSIRVIKIEADWNDEQDITNIRPDDIDGYIEYTYNGKTDSLKTDNWVKVDSVWTQEFDIPTTATITNWGEESVPEGYEFEKGTDTANTYKFFNNLKHFDILVSKNVDVDGVKADRHKNQEFSFTFKSIPNRTVEAIKNKKDTISLTLNASGIATFSLKDTNTMKLTKIPYGASYSVVESNYGIYAVSTALTGDDINTGDATAAGTAIVYGNNVDTIADDFLKGSVNVAYKNSIRVIKIEADWNDEQDITNVRPDDINGYIEYTYNGTKDSLKTNNWVKVDSVWTQEFDIPTTATITNWGEESVPEGYEFEKGTDTANTYKFFNNLKYFDILVAKNVNVDRVKAERHKTKDFNFTFKSIPNRTVAAIKNSKDTISLTLNANGITTFTLKDTNTMKLTKIPYGASYSVIESNYGIYSVSTTLTGDDINTGDTETIIGTAIPSGSNVDTISDSFLKGNVNVVFNNSIRVVKIEADWNDEQDITNIRPDDIDGYIEYTYNGVKDSLKTDNWVKVDSVWTQEFDIPTTATITNWGEESVPTGYEYEKGTDTANTYKFFNNLQYFDVTISDTVIIDGEKEDRHKNKEFTYTVGALIPNRNVTVVITRATGGDTTITFTANASGELSFILKDGEKAVLKDLPYGSTCSVSESDYDIYTVSSAVSDGTTTQNIIGANVARRTLTSDLDIAYTNTLKVIKLVKTWHDGSSPVRPDNLSGFIKYRLGTTDFTLNTFDTSWVKVDSVWTHKFDLPSASTVTDWGEASVPTGYEYAKGAFVNNVCYISNKLRRHNITVKNTVSGDGADQNKNFSYVLALRDPGQNPMSNATFTIVKTSATGVSDTTTITTGANGECNFTLKHNEVMEFLSFPFGTKYSVTEGDYVPYTVSSKLSYYSGSQPQNFDYNGIAVPQQNLYSNHNIVFNNLLEYIDVVFPGLPIQKHLVGRQWSNTDTFKFALTPLDAANPMPAVVFTNPSTNVLYSPLTITKDSTQGQDESHRKASFGPITFTANDLDLANGKTEKTFKYQVRELHPAEGGANIPYITYSVASFNVEITLYIDENNKLALKAPVYKQNVVVNGQSSTINATPPFTFSNVYNKVKKVHRLDAEKVFTTRDINKPLVDSLFQFTLRPVGQNASHAPMPKNTDTLPNGTLEYTAYNDGEHVRFYTTSAAPIGGDNLGDGLLFDLSSLIPVFGIDALKAGVPFIYEISEKIPDGFTNNGDGTWQRTVTENGEKYIELYDGVVHYRQVTVKYVEIAGEGSIITESGVSGDNNYQDFYYTNQAKTQKHVLTDDEKSAHALAGGAPIFNNYAIAIRDIKVNKNWNDYNDVYGIRPSVLTVNLLRNGAPTGQSITLSGNDWTGQFANLPMGDVHGNYTYSVEEVVPNHYEPTYTNTSAHEFTISNRVVSLGDDATCGTIVGEDQLSTNPTIDCGTLTDARDGQTYATARINGYCWMTENLRYKSHSARAYSSTLSPDGDANVAVFGYLYTWEEAANLSSPNADPVYVNGYVHGICPEGWHLPTYAEINVLHTYDAFALKSYEKWVDEGYNTSKFNALPAGSYKANVDRCEGLLTEAWFHGDTNNSAFCIQYKCCRTTLNKAAGNNAYSVRCVKNHQ